MKSNNKIRTQLNDLYCGISDSFIEVKEDVSENRLRKDSAIEKLEGIYNNGKEDYMDIKSNNLDADDLFVEGDKKFTPLFRNIQNCIEQYNADLTYNSDFIK